MKYLFILIAVLIGFVYFGILAHRYPGYVLIDVNGWIIETTAVLLGVVILALFAVLYYVLRFVAGLWHVPGGYSVWKDKRRKSKADLSLINGLIKLAECKWSDAEQQVLRYAEQSKTPLLNYLAAARAAQEQGSFEQRDKYLKLAHQSMPEAKVAVGITQAELQLSQNQKEQALATLRHLQQIDPKHLKVLKTLAKLYKDLADWDHLIQLMPNLRKTKAMPEEAIRQLEKLAYLQHLLQAGQTEVKALQDSWYRIPQPLQADQDVLIAYIQRLIALRSSDLAEPMIRNALKKKWNTELVRLYGLIVAADAQQQLNFAEGLLQNHEHDPVLLLTLGRLCLRNSLWGKARDYLEASIGATRQPEAYAELGRLLEKLGEKDKAMECYRIGLQQVPGCDSAVEHAQPRLELEHKGQGAQMLANS